MVVVGGAVHQVDGAATGAGWELAAAGVPELELSWSCSGAGGRGRWRAARVPGAWGLGQRQATLELRAQGVVSRTWRRGERCTEEIAPTRGAAYSNNDGNNLGLAAFALALSLRKLACSAPSGELVAPPDVPLAPPGFNRAFRPVHFG